MPRPAKPRRPPPEGFRIDAYQCADLDARDWYINLWARRWLVLNAADTPADAVEVEEMLAATPVLRRSSPDLPLRRLDICDSTVARAMRNEPIRPVWRVKDNEAVTLAGRLDDLLAPMIRVDLSQSDARLVEAFQAWVAVERRRLREHAPSSPGLAVGAATLHSADVKTWARLHLLAVADLTRRVPGASDAEIAAAIGGAAGASEDEARTARKRLRALFGDGFTLERILL
jgi:hypothetical protein